MSELGSTFFIGSREIRGTPGSSSYSLTRAMVALAIDTQGDPVVRAGLYSLHRFQGDPRDPRVIRLWLKLT